MSKVGRVNEYIKIVKLKAYGYPVIMVWDKKNHIELARYGKDYQPIENLIEFLAKLNGIEIEEIKK